MTGLAAGIALSACATPPDPSDEAAVEAFNEANDPLEPANRYFFALNQAMDELLLKPFAGWYHIALPDPAEDGVRNFLRNLNSPVVLLNDLFQGEGERAGDTVARFLINSTLGLAGFIDVAKHMGFNYHSEDFGQTLAVYGIGEGPYLHLPVIGPSNPRDVGGRVVDMGLDPLTYIGAIYDVGWINTTRFALNAIDTRARNLEAVEELKRGSIDFYATVRSLYRQYRNDAIRNGDEESADDAAPLPPQ